MATSIYDFKVTDINGKETSLSDYKDKVLLIVNVASKCGFTKQYAGLEELYREYKNKGLVVLGFPCNEFLEQEPGAAGDIAEFCQKNYGVTFPMFEKVGVKKGAGQSPVYTWLTDAEKNGWNTQEPSWNFCKYLINEKGELTHFFASKVKPDSPEFLAASGL